MLPPFARKPISLAGERAVGLSLFCDRVCRGRAALDCCGFLSAWVLLHGGSFPRREGRTGFPCDLFRQESDLLHRLHIAAYTHPSLPNSFLSHPVQGGNPTRNTIRNTIRAGHARARRDTVSTPS